MAGLRVYSMAVLKVGAKVMKWVVSMVLEMDDDLVVWKAVLKVG